MLFGKLIAHSNGTFVQYANRYVSSCFVVFLSEISSRFQFKFQMDIIFRRVLANRILYFFHVN